MRLIRPFWWRLACVAVVSAYLVQVSARAEAVSPVVPTQPTAPAAASTAPTAAARTPAPAANPTPPVKKSWRSRIGGLAAKLKPGHDKSAAKEPRLSKPGPVKRHAPDSAPA